MISGVPGRAQPGSLQPGASTATTVSGFTFTGKSASVGSVRFTRPTRLLSFMGKSASVGTVSFVARYVYTTPLEVIAHMSATLREATPTTPDPQSMFVSVDGSAGAEEIALLGVQHGVEAGQGTEVVHSDLVLTLAEDMPAGSYIVTVEPTDESWDAATVTHATQPTVRTPSATATVTGLSRHDEVTIDITDIVVDSVSQEGATGAEWTGLKVTVDGSEQIVFYGAFSTDHRPKIRKEVSQPPVAPFNLLPAEGLAVSEVKPELRWDFRDLDAEDSLSSIQVQIDDTDDFDAVLYDSGQVSSTTSRFDLASPPTGAAATPTLVAGNTYYWRPKQWDNHGSESEWGPVAEFTVTAKGTLTVTPIDPVPTPVTSWTLSLTQEAYYLAFEELVGGTWLTVWESPWQLSTATEVTLPDEYVLQEGKQYRRVLRVTDTVERVDQPGDRYFYEDIEEFTVTAVVMA